MTIASEITRINNNIASAYTACNGKGATMPATQNSANLATCIGSIQTGGVGITREVDNGTYQIPQTRIDFELPSNATSIGAYALYYAFYNGNLKTLNLNNITTIETYGMYGMNYHPTNYQPITMSVPDLSKIETIQAYGMYLAFGNRDFSNASTATFDLSSVTSIGNYGLYGAFSGTGVKNINLSGLTTLTGNFACARIAYDYILSSISFTNLTQIGDTTGNVNCSHFSEAFYKSGSAGSSTLTITFPELTAIYCTGRSSAANGTFYKCNTVRKFYFPKLTTITYGGSASSSNQQACKYIFSDCTGLNELHFAAANQTAIEASAGYSTAWGRGAGNVTIYFDL